MTPLYEIQYEMTPERYLAFCNRPMGKYAAGAMRNWRIKSSLLILLSALLVALSASIENWVLAGAAAALCAFCVYNRFWRRDRLNKKQYARLRQSQTTPEWRRTIRLYPDELTVDDANTQTRFAYADLCRLSEDEEYFYLWRDADFVLRLPKDGFTAGDGAGFREFVLQKLGPQSPENEKEG